MRSIRTALVLAPLLFQTACATGYLADRFQERSAIVEPQLLRFGMGADDGHCVADKLGRRLSLVQLRQLEMRARVVRAGLSDPTRLTLNDLIIVANGMGDPEVRGELDLAVSQCNIRAASLSVGTAIAARPAPAADEREGVIARGLAGNGITATPGPTGEGVTIARGPDGRPLTALPAPDGNSAPELARGPDGRPLTELPAPGGIPAVSTGAPIPLPTSAGSGVPDAAPTWLNLGAAGSGQAISIDGSSVERDSGSRTAWFRMIDPGQGPSRTWFRLRIDCSARTIEPRAMRRIDEAGAVVQEQVYPPGYERPGPVENGTVMEIAFLSLCT